MQTHMNIVKKKTDTITTTLIEKPLPKLSVPDEVIINSDEYTEVLRQFEYIIENGLTDGLRGPIDIKVDKDNTITVSDISYKRQQ